MSLIFPPHWRATVAFLATLVFLSAPAKSQNSSPTNPIELLPSEGKILGKAKIDHDLNNIEVIGSWRDPDGCIKWSASFPSQGIYDAFLQYSEADAKQGSLMELAVGNQGLQARLEYTFDWENPCYHYLGQVQVSQAGVVPVNLRVLEKRGTWVASIRLIRFCRSKATEMEDPPHDATHPAVP